MANKVTLTGSECPRIRPVEAFPAAVDQRKVVCLRDPEGIALGVVTLTYPAFFIVGLLDGKKTVRDIQAAYFREFNQLIYTEAIQELLETLDKNLFLDSESFSGHRRRLEEQFIADPARKAVHAGTAYHSDPRRLREEMDGFFCRPDGFGLSNTLAGMENVRGLIAPHIDFHRGGPTYSWAYGALRPAGPHDLYIILGTSHAPIPYPFCVCLKDFETPLGTAPVDRFFGERLLKELPVNFCEGQWAHRHEHSIEFQAVFLKYLFPDQDAFSILPILCGNVPNQGSTVEEKLQRLYLDEFLDALKNQVGDTQRRVCFIAGADLAHMGPRFGDRSPVDAQLLSTLQAADSILLQKAEQADAEGFSQEVRETQDRYRICGYPPIYALLRASGTREGKLLRYGQAVEPDGSQVVTFASMAFY